MYLKSTFTKQVRKQSANHDSNELLKPGFNNDLLKDLSRQTGQNIKKVKIQKVNIKRGNARLEVYFKDKVIE